jgi:hypothetical protein
MTADILIGSFDSVKPHSCTWSRSVSKFADSAKVQIPAIAVLKSTGDEYETVQTGETIREGMPISIACGYDSRNVLRFKGFISRVNFSVPLELECEGYSYQLRKKLNFSKSYKSTTVKQILLDVTAGTDIKLSKAIPDIPIDKAVFEHVNGMQVLEWLKEKCLLAVYFNYEELYVGALALEPKQTVKYRLGWNTVTDKDLKFGDREFAEVRIELGAKRDKTGEMQKTYSGNTNGQVKKLYTALEDSSVQADIAEQKRKEETSRGYTGSITAFLEPIFEPGMAVSIEDAKYTERSGTYFGSGVEGSFGPSGGRQKITIGFSLGKK